MGLPVVEYGFGDGGDVGSVAVVPDITLMPEVVETNNGENECQG